MRGLFSALFLFGLLAPMQLSAQPTTGSATEDLSAVAEATTVTTSAETRVPPSAALRDQRPTLDFGLDEESEILTAPISLSGGTYAVFHTTEGDILVRLFPEKAPKTVENFVALATGQKPWKHPITMAEIQTPVFNNTTIYKTVENALIYGGDPINRGLGDPGFTLPLEFSPDLKFDQPGMLAMNLSGPNASASRWMISLRTIPDYTGRYPIFGKVVAGMDVARTISRKPTKRPTVPLDPVLLNSVEIIQIPEGKTTTAQYETEDGKRFVTIEKDFRDAEALPSAPDADDASTTSTDEATTGTDASEPATTTTQDSKDKKSAKK